MLIALTLMVAMSVHARKDTLAMEDSAMILMSVWSSLPAMSMLTATIQEAASTVNVLLVSQEME
jgi:hypothetical protein